MPRDALMRLFEAARWAPSAINIQPWRFVYAHRETPQWDPLFAALMESNQAWVTNASVLMFAISDRFRRKEGAEPSPNRSHSFDTGSAWTCLALQAQHMGWAAHAMGGFVPEKAHAATGAPESDYRIEAAIAVGRLADKSTLSEALQAREVPSTRGPASGFVFEGRISP